MRVDIEMISNFFFSHMDSCDSCVDIDIQGRPHVLARYCQGAFQSGHSDLVDLLM